MGLTSGTKLGPYEILSALGAGGMGEVYRARDTRLSRDVAIKILPETFSSDAERLQRFEQEARILGTLSHPNLLAIYDVGEQGGIHFLVSEFLEGQTLRDLLKTEPLRPRHATEYGLQIAKGLAAAHEKNIVHRDLKPENIFMTSDGRVKILDFGLAKVSRLEPRDAMGMTMTAATGVDVVLGTVGYMAPEQVRGQKADTRSDFFAFGAVLYEMLSGKRAFQGATPADTLSAILKEEPPELTEAGRQVPPGLEAIVRHCLEKNPQRRFQSAQDLAFNLEQLTHSSGSSSSIVTTPTGRQHRLRWPALAVLGGLAIATATFFFGQHTAPARKLGFHQLTFQRGRVLQARFSPDGQTIVYSAAWNGEPSDVYSTRADRAGARSLDLKGGQLLAVSPTGELAVLVKSNLVSTFASTGTLAILPLAGGAPREVAENVEFADFSPDGSQLAIIREQGPRCRLEYPVGKTIYEFTGWLSHPRISPSGDHIAFAEHTSIGDSRGSLVVTDLSGKRKTLVNDWSEVIDLSWSPHGDEIWFTGSAVNAQRSVFAVNLRGEERALFEVPGNLVLADVFHDGRVLIVRENQRRETSGILAGEAKERDFSWFDWTFPTDISPDGSVFIFHEAGVGGGRDFAQFLRKTDGSPPVLLGPGNGGMISPDAKWVLNLPAGHPAPVTLLPTGAGEIRQVTNDNIYRFDVKWLPDGKHFLSVGTEPGHNNRWYIQDLEAGSPKAITPEGYGSYFTPVSPDGKLFVASCLDLKPCIVPVAGGPARSIPSGEVTDSAIQWSQDGRYLYIFRYGALPTTVWRVDIVSGKRTLWKSLAPSDLAGVGGVTVVIMTRDTRVCLYSYLRTFSDLFVVHGIT